MEITQELVKSLYDYKDGKIYWKVRPANHVVNIGDEAGHLRVDKTGDRFTCKVNGSIQFRYRVIFLWHHGYLPKQVDHINHIMTDDRIENLRAADAYGNNKNRTSAKGSTSKYLGVYWNKRDSNWRAAITYNHKLYSIGRFDKEEDAALAYNEMAQKHHGEFANLNIIN